MSLFDSYSAFALLRHTKSTCHVTFHKSHTHTHIHTYKSKVRVLVVQLHAHVPVLNTFLATVYFMHAKGHSDRSGNSRADALADKGATAENDEHVYRNVCDLGGVVRFSQMYQAADSGRDCDLEKNMPEKTYEATQSFHQSD